MMTIQCHIIISYNVILYNYIMSLYIMNKYETMKEKKSNQYEYMYLFIII